MKTKRLGRVKPKKIKARERPLPRGDYRIYDNRFGGMPDSIETILEYSDVVEIKSNTSPHAGYVFRGNSVYDPDYTGTGHQPRYFDQFMEVYGRYLVLSAKLTCQNVGTSGFMITAPTTDPLAFGPSTLEYVELPRSAFVASGNAATIPSPKTVSLYDTQGVLGLTRAQLEDLNYSGTATTNPNQTWYINIGFVCSGLTTTSFTTTVLVHISYKVLFFDRSNSTPSFEEKPPAPPSGPRKLPRP